MFGSMPSNVGTFAMHIFGDVGFMEEILLAISAMKQSGYFAAAGGLGAVVGLLITMFQGAAKGGKDLDLGGWFVTVLLFIAIFGPGATVQINHVRPTAAMPAVEVPHIPLGIAVTASLVTSIGKRVTIATETAFADVNGPASIANGGPGRALKWLASIRMLYDPDHSSPYIQRVRSSLQYYLDQCTTTAFQIQPGRKDTAPMADILDPVNGYGLLSDSIFVNYVNPDTGATSVITCRNATLNLDALRTNSTMLQEHVRVAEAKVSDYRAAAPAPEFNTMMSTLGVSALNAQRYMFSSVARGVFHNVAMRDQGGATPEQQALWGMVIQQTEASATDFAGQEAGFLQTLPSLITFMEALIFCATPFMAFIMLVGRAGFQSFLKLLFIPAYIAAWFPTMAVINAFSVHRVSNAIADMQAEMVSTGSLQASWEITQAALSALSTSSMLMASTPVIALFLLTGGAYVTAQVANTLKGVDRNNEKMASPDAQTVGAAQTITPISTMSELGGSKGAGIAQPTITALTSGSFESSSYGQSMQERGKQYGLDLANVLSNTRGQMNDGFRQLTDANRADVSQIMSEGLQATSSERDALRQGSSIMQAAAWERMMSAAAGTTGRIDGGAVIRGTQALAKELLNHELGKQLANGSLSGAQRAGVMAQAAAMFLPQSKLGKFGMVALEGLGSMISAHGTAALSDASKVSEVGNQIVEGANIVENALGRTNMAEARAGATAGKVADYVSKSANSESWQDQATQRIGELSTEASRFIEGTQEAKKQAQQGGADYKRDAPEVANEIAAAAQSGNVNAQAFLAAVRDLPAAVQNDLRSFASHLDPGGVDTPGGEQKQTATMGVLAAMGLGGSTNPDRWKNAGGSEAMGERLAELGGHFLDYQVSGGHMSSGQAGSFAVGQGPGFSAAPGDGVPGAGEIVSQSSNARKANAPDIQGRATTVGFDRAGYDAVRSDVGERTGGMQTDSPSLGAGAEEWVFDASNKNSAEMPASPTGVQQQKLEEYRDGNKNMTQDLNGGMAVGGESSSRAEGDQGTPLGRMAAAFSRGEGGVTSEAPTDRAAIALAGAVIERSAVGGLSAVDARASENAGGNLTPEESAWVDSNLGAVGSSGGTSLPGITPSTDSSTVQGVVAAFMANPDNIPKLIDRAEAIAGSKVMDNAGSLENVKTTRTSRGAYYTDRQVGAAVNVLNANGKLDQQAIDAGKRFAEDEEEEAQ